MFTQLGYLSMADLSLEHQRSLDQRSFTISVLKVLIARRAVFISLHINSRSEGENDLDLYSFHHPHLRPLGGLAKNEKKKKKTKYFICNKKEK